MTTATYQSYKDAEIEFTALLTQAMAHYHSKYGGYPAQIAVCPRNVAKARTHCTAQSIPADIEEIRGILAVEVLLAQPVHFSLVKARTAAAFAALTFDLSDAYSQAIKAGAVALAAAGHGHYTYYGGGGNGGTLWVYDHSPSKRDSLKCNPAGQIIG